MEIVFEGWETPAAHDYFPYPLSLSLIFLVPWTAFKVQNAKSVWRLG
jgi:hypothetical protein